MCEIPLITVQSARMKAQSHCAGTPTSYSVWELKHIMTRLILMKDLYAFQDLTKVWNSALIFKEAVGKPFLILKS